MGLESDVSSKESYDELKKELAPRNGCFDYVHGYGGKAELVDKSSFDSYYRDRSFVDGPYMDSVGDSNEPYSPNRQAFGRLESGKVIYCELSEEGQKKTDKLLKEHRGETL